MDEPFHRLRHRLGISDTFIACRIIRTSRSICKYGILEAIAVADSVQCIQVPTRRDRQVDALDERQGAHGRVDDAERV